VAFGNGEPTQTIEYLAELEQAVIPTAWVKPESLGAKVEENAGKLDAGRTTSAAQVAALRGALKIKAAQELKPGETLCTLPPALRPASPQALDICHGIATTSVGNRLLVAANGVVTLAVAVLAAEEVFLDGITFPLT
jgi:hypothetical protein